jgi:GTP cyclohydrolase II
MRSGQILPEYLASIGEISRRPAKRPTVTLSYAQSLDGSIAVRRGARYTLSGAKSQELTHRLRAANDAILVGINTVVADNPSLTVRLVEGHSPLPIVLDSRLRLPLNSHLLTNATPPLIATTPAAGREQETRLKEFGATIERILPDERGWVDLNALLIRLADLGIKNLMVEGGARVITSFLSLRLVDWMVITIAPTLLGGLHAVENPLASCARDGGSSGGPPDFKYSAYEQVGQDLVFWSSLSWSNC